jgi:hypothetical protein
MFEGLVAGAAAKHLADTLPTNATPSRTVVRRTFGNVVYITKVDISKSIKFSGVSETYRKIADSAPSSTDGHLFEDEVEIEIEKQRPLQQIHEFRKFKNDWDGYGSAAPSSKILHLALRLLDAWDWEIGVVPDLSILSGGEVCFELFSSSGELLGVVDLYEDAKMSYALSINGVGNDCGLLTLTDKADRAALFQKIEQAKKSM